MGNPSKELVVLMHGIGQPRVIMSGLAEFLEDSGYPVLNLSCPETEKTVDGLIEEIQKKLDHHDVSSAFEKSHFISHSLGGLVTRAFIKQNRPANLGRVVMLAPPNINGEAANLLQDIWLHKEFFASENASEAPVDFDLGIIAGTSAAMSMFTSETGPNDGAVTVEGTKLPGMAAHLCVPAAHSFIMNNPAARRAILSFLQDGTFPTPH